LIFTQHKLFSSEGGWLLSQRQNSSRVRDQSIGGHYGVNWEIATSNCFFSLASKRLVRVAVRYPNFLEKKCGFRTVSQSSVPAVLGKEVRVLNCITRKKEIHSQGEKHSQGVSFLVSSFNLGLIKEFVCPTHSCKKTY